MSNCHSTPTFENDVSLFEINRINDVFLSTSYPKCNVGLNAVQQHIQMD